VTEGDPVTELSTSPSALLSERRSFVAGTWVNGDSALAVHNPADEQWIAEVETTPLVEVDRAIGAARRSFDEGVFASLPATRRAELLHDLLDHIIGRTDELAATVIAESGQPRSFAEYAQVRGGVAQGRAYIDLYLSMVHE
jgi:aldehyde dehydrogenase (NAD+)